jgi:dihydrofolate reductase
LAPFCGSGYGLGPAFRCVARVQEVVVAKIVYGLNQSLDGYVDHQDLPVPGPKLFRHFIELAQGVTGSVYGRTMYGLMRYWDGDEPEWDDPEREYAAAWQRNPKWVVSRTLQPDDLGPNATLHGDLERLLRTLKAEQDGEIEIAGTLLAQSATELGLIDEYRIYLHPVVLGAGKRYFAGPAPELRLASTDQLDDNVIRLTYVPA